MSPLARRLLVGAVSAVAALLAGVATYRMLASPAPALVIHQVAVDPGWVAEVRRFERTHPPEWVRALPDSTLVRERLAPDSPKARYHPGLVRIPSQCEYDEHADFRLLPSRTWRMRWAEREGGGYVARTNSRGLRMDREVMSERPDLRVLLTGDSHLEGVCSNDEGAAGVLERLLAERSPGETVEVLNAAVGGYCGYNQLGVLERHLPDGIDVFVQVFYGGNDFSGDAAYRHYYERTAFAVFPPDAKALLKAAVKLSPYATGQVFQQAMLLNHVPEEAALAVRTACDLLDEIARVCAQHGVRFVFAYLPPPSDVEWDAHREILEEAAALLGLGPEELALTDRMADALLAHARERGVDVVDLRPLLRADGPFYWMRDLHLNVRGHARVGAALADRLRDAG